MMGIEKEHTPQRFQLGDLTIDLDAYCIRDALGTTTPLTPQERLLLRTLIDARGSAVSMQELGRLVWGWECGYSATAIWKCVSSLRRKIGDDSHRPHHILLVRRVGYRLNLKAEG
jgi:two-component system, OmpR family, alkaline phosphatase synthesis response regulator PhoP